MIDSPHYVRFTRALAIAATVGLALPACSSESTSPGDGDATTGAPAATDPAGENQRCRGVKDTPTPAAPGPSDTGGQPIADAGGAAVPDSAVDPDASAGPSGPLAPPELPASFA